jgi:O-antigen/teichoic acid export membrane protein
LGDERFGVRVNSAIKWSFLSELAAKAVVPLVFVILARLLTPEDYGVAAAATIFISFCQMFWDYGLGKAVIQYQGERVSAANAAFWVNIFLGILLALLVVVLADTMAERLFHDARVAPVLQVLSLQLLLSAAASVPTALLQKDMRFKPLFWVRLLTVAGPAVISIPLAALGAGYWALVAGTLAGQFLQLPLLWRLNTWRPSFAFDWTVARRLGGFSGWVMLSGLSAWFYLWADSLIVGTQLGAHELGLYRTGNAFVTMIYSFLFAPLLPVLYSHFSEIQHDHARVNQILSKVVRTITLTALPVAFLLFAFGDQISGFIFGQRWEGIGVVVAIMALTHGYAWTVGVNGEVYRAVGRPEYETRVMAGTLPLYALAYWVSIQYGLIVFLWTRFSLALVGVLLHLWTARLAIGFPLGRSVAYMLKVSVVGLPLLALHYCFNGMAGEGVLVQTFLVLVAAAWALGYPWLLERNSLIPEAVGMFKQRIQG